MSDRERRLDCPAEPAEESRIDELAVEVALRMRRLDAAVVPANKRGTVLAIHHSREHPQSQESDTWGLENAICRPGGSVMLIDKLGGLEMQICCIVLGLANGFDRLAG